MSTEPLATVSAPPSRSSTPAVLLAVLSGLFLLWSMVALLPSMAMIGVLSALGEIGYATLSLVGTVTSFAAAVAVLVGAILSLRGEPAGARTVRRVAIAMLLYTIAATTASAVWLFRVDAPVLLSRNSPGAVGGLIGSVAAGLLWWGLVLWLSRRL